MCSCTGNCGCSSLTLSSIPGPQGPQGPAGADGTNGASIIQTSLGNATENVGSTYEVFGFLTFDPVALSFVNSDGLNLKGFISTLNYDPPLAYPATAFQLVMTSTLPVVGTIASGTVIFTYEDVMSEEETFKFDIDLIRNSNNSIAVLGNASIYSVLQASPINLTDKSNINQRAVCIWNPIVSPSMNSTFYIAIQGKVDAGTVDLQALYLSSELKKHI